MRIRQLLPIVFCLLCLYAPAQEIFHFTQGLYVPSGSRYGREALYTDGLAYQLYTNTIATPAAGKLLSVTPQGDSLLWRAVNADSAGRFAIRRWENIATGNTFGNPNRVDRGTGYFYFTYTAPAAKMAWLNIKGNSAVYVNGAPHMGDPYSTGYMYIPLLLKKGLNEFYVRGMNLQADLIFPTKPVALLTNDLTLPMMVKGENNSRLQAAMVVINTSNKPVKSLAIQCSLGGNTTTTALPEIPAFSSRKVAFGINGSAAAEKGRYAVAIALMAGNKLLDTASFSLEAVTPSETYTRTFTSNIDGSLQYYAVTPQQPAAKSSGQALFLSVHGAGVEALGQARAYRSKDWGNLVAATNRRPRGFNWEDWGRLDALEVLALAKKQFEPDPSHIYLTGHSMGGHGTWFLGATYPGEWAAIGACAGYPTLKSYGSADGAIPDSSNDPSEKILLRASNQSDVPKLVKNYQPLGVYILHGDSDHVVPVGFARQMRGLLGAFHPDYSYYEYPGGEHWFGDQSVDWKPMFDYFKWHKRLDDSLVNEIDFTTASPGINGVYRWAGIWQQQQPLAYSELVLHRNNATHSITGSSTNVAKLSLAVSGFAANTDITIRLDSPDAIHYTTKTNNDTIFLQRKTGSWALAGRPSLREKGPHRYGTFKDAFNHRMLFVYSTGGNAVENEWSYQKAVYDAETWYYRGNGAVDIIADKDYNADTFKDRGVILFGNASTNKAWPLLLADCPIQVERNKITAGSKSWQGDDLCAYFVWPQKQSDIASVGVVTGTGLPGMKAANANQYFAGASGFPDYMIYSLGLLKNGSADIKLAGFYGNDWELEE